MKRRPPISTRTATLFPHTTLCRSPTRRQVRPGGDRQHAGRYIPSPRRTVPRQIPPRPARAEPEGPGQSSDAGRRDRIPQAETGGGGVAGPNGSAAPGTHRRTGPDDGARTLLQTEAILVAEGQGILEEDVARTHVPLVGSG